jgi:hypothetical protein
MWITDFDGFGVLAHEECGFCCHPSGTGDTCDCCGGNMDDPTKSWGVKGKYTLEQYIAYAIYAMLTKLHENDDIQYKDIDAHMEHAKRMMMNEVVPHMYFSFIINAVRQHEWEATSEAFKEGQKTR